MNEFITKMLKFVSIEALLERGWLEIVQILMPVFILVLVFLGLSFIFKINDGKLQLPLCALP